MNSFPNTEKILPQKYFFIKRLDSFIKRLVFVLAICIITELQTVNKELANQFESELAKNKVDHWKEQHVVKRMDNLHVNVFVEQFLPTFQNLYDIAESDIQVCFNQNLVLNICLRI